MPRFRVTKVTNLKTLSALVFTTVQTDNVVLENDIIVRPGEKNFT